MSGAGKMQEPSMDDIIRSIRNIIADDAMTPAPTPQAKPKSAAKPASAAASSSVIRLSETQIASPAVSAPVAKQPVASAKTAEPALSAAKPAPAASSSGVGGLAERIAAIVGGVDQIEAAAPAKTASDEMVAAEKDVAVAKFAANAEEKAAEEIRSAGPSLDAMDDVDDPFGLADAGEVSEDTVEKLFSGAQSAAEASESVNGSNDDLSFGDEKATEDSADHDWAAAERNADFDVSETAKADAATFDGGESVDEFQGEPENAADVQAEPVLAPTKPLQALGDAEAVGAVAEDDLEDIGFEATADADVVEASVEEKAVQATEELDVEPEAAAHVRSEDASAATAVANATSKALSGDNAEVPAKPAVQGEKAGGRTLEDSVRDMLRPMIREWLDANMPRILERAIAEEIDKK